MSPLLSVLVGSRLRDQLTARVRPASFVSEVPGAPLAVPGILLAPVRQLGSRRIPDEHPLRVDLGENPEVKTLMYAAGRATDG